MADIKGMGALLRRLDALHEPRPVLRALQLSTIHEAQALAPRKTGFLQRNIAPGPVTSTYAVVLSKAPYAAPVEFGSRPHVIRPKKARVLAWGGSRTLSGRLSKGSKADHFAREVHHPGNKAQPHLIPGAKRAIAGLRDIVVKTWNSAA